MLVVPEIAIMAEQLRAAPPETGPAVIPAWPRLPEVWGNQTFVT